VAEYLRRRADGRRVERFLKRFVRQRLVDFELVTVNKQVGAHGVEVGAAGVRWQCAHIHVHAEEIAQRVGILAPVEPAEGDHTLLIRKALAGCDHRVGQVVEEIGLRFGRGLRLVLRRHFAGIQRIEDFLPAFGGGQIGNRER
jgi:hypothetical protein